MRALVTGAAGFLGSHLVEHLTKNGWDVIGLDNLKWSTRKVGDLTIGDVRTYEFVDRMVRDVDIVYHLAAQINVDYGNKHAKETSEINIKGTLNILEACRKHQKKLIFASSSEVYGTAQTEKISETHPTDCQSVYAATKLAGDRLCKAYRDTWGVDARILRSFNAFGRYQRPDSYGGVIAIFVQRALAGKPPVIFGDGLQERDYLSVLDVVRGYELITQVDPGGPLNIGTGRTITINQLAKLVQKYTNCPDPIHIDARPGEVRRLCADTTKAKSLGWKPTITFEQGLKDYIKWAKETRTTS